MAKQLRDTVRRIIDATTEPNRLDRDSWLSRLGDLLLDGIQEIELNAEGKPVREDLPVRGCNVELTTVKIDGGKLAWTFGFEAFGKLDEVCEQLRAVAASMSARQPPDFGRPS